jgi:predicted DNA-binding transcriptional regulator AlpA
MKFLRFADLKAAGIVASWPMLRRRIERDGFPPGRMLGPNTRAWSEAEIDAWLRSRPTAGPAPRGVAKARRRRRQREADAGTGSDAAGATSAL